MDRVDIIACGMNADINIDANVEELDEGIYINFFKTRKTSGLKIGRIFSIVRNNIVLFLYLLKNTNKDDNKEQNGMINSFYMVITHSH